MLTEVKVFSARAEAPVLPLLENGRSETDLIQVNNIEGLDPVKASVNTSLYGSVDGASYTGSSVPARNIVLTLQPNPDWITWTYESLRKLIYSYFMPKQQVKLEFYSDDLIPVEISGIVETISVNQFSKEPEFQVSIICPDPYFSALDETVITDQSIRANGDPTLANYIGNIETGFSLKVSVVSGTNPTYVAIRIGNPATSYIKVNAAIDASKIFELSSISRRKFVRTVNVSSGVTTNLLPKLELLVGSSWPILVEGENEFSVITDSGVQNWELKYIERFGGL